MLLAWRRAALAIDDYRGRFGAHLEARDIRASGDRPVHPVIYDGRVVAVAGREGCCIVDGLESGTWRFVAAMCLFHREVEKGRAPGPFTSESAERWARLILDAEDQQDTVRWNGCSAADPSAA